MANAAHIWTFREGKIVRLTVFQTLQEARSHGAAGVGETAAIVLSPEAYAELEAAVASSPPAADG